MNGEVYRWMFLSQTWTGTSHFTVKLMLERKIRSACVVFIGFFLGRRGFSQVMSFSLCE